MILDKYFDEIERISLNNKKIILLEDCTNKQAEISEICIDLNVDLACFSNANNAFEAALRSLPDLLIVDWRLPGSKDGISFIKSIREKCNTSIPILFFTEYSNPDIRLKSIESHATVFFDKADPPNLFVAQIKALLNLANDKEYTLTLSDNTVCSSISASELRHIFNFHAAVQKDCRVEVSIPQLINSLDIEDSRLRNIVQEYLKVSLQKYLTLYRLYLACILLKKRQSIKEIASSFGYANTSNFSNVFRKTYKLTPAQYQRNHQ